MKKLSLFIFLVSTVISAADLGTVWTDLGQQYSQDYITSLAVINDTIALAGTGAGGKILRSTDAGATWTDLGQQYSQALMQTFARINDTIVLAGTATGGKILRSTDAGLTWTDLGQQYSQDYIYCLARINDTVALAGTRPDGKILRSTDAGATWTDLGQQYSQSLMQTLVRINDTIVLAGTATGGKILRSTDAGLTWTDLGTQYSQEYIYCLEVINDTVALAGTRPDGKILRSVGDPVSLPVTIATDPANTTDSLGNDTLLYITYTGTAPVSAQWWKATDSIGPYSAITDSTNDTLRLLNLTRADSGWYRASVSNSFGSDTSAAGRVTTLPVLPSLDTLKPLYGVPIQPVKLYGSDFGDSTANIRGMLNSVVCDSFLYFTDDSAAFYPEPVMNDTLYRGNYSAGLIFDTNDTIYFWKQYYLRVPYSVR